MLSIDAEKMDGLTARVRRSKGASLLVIVINGHLERWQLCGCDGRWVPYSAAFALSHRLLLAILLAIESWWIPVSTTPQKRALKNYRSRLEKRGMARFEILGLNADRELIRSLAKRLSEGDADARRIRATLKKIVGNESLKGGILAALRRSPLVGAELGLEREVTHGRSLDL